MTVIYAAAGIAILTVTAAVACALLAVHRTTRELRTIEPGPVSQGRSG